jgi:transposase InsO family protein
MDERARFVLEALEGWGSMSALCEQYHISRPVGYKWLRRYQREGLAGLLDRSRAPARQARATPAAVVAAIVALRQRHPSWGPRKLRARLRHLEPATPWPAASTIGAILRREGLCPRRRRRRARLAGAWQGERTPADRPNRVWTTDFKGQFRLGEGRLCYPLTIVDGYSRYLLACRALPGTGTAGVQATFERVFQAYGLPEVLRSDNGVPFSGPALGGLSKLAVWWLRLGIRLERTRPAHPQDNGAHERLHRTLKAEATRPPRRTPELQQRAFEAFRTEYNTERPHEALGQQPPASCYVPSARRPPARLPPPSYPAQFACRRLTQHGLLTWHGGRYFVSETLARQTVGLEPTDTGAWRLYFGPALLGQVEEYAGVFRPYGRRLTVRRRIPKTVGDVLGLKC